MSDCLGLKVGLETEGKWTWRIFLEWWKYSKYGLWRWLHNYVIYSKSWSCTLKTGEFDWMLSILQDMLKRKKKVFRTQLGVISPLPFVSQVKTLDRHRGRSASNSGFSRRAKTSSSLIRGRKGWWYWAPRCSTIAEQSTENEVWKWFLPFWEFSN